MPTKKQLRLLRESHFEYSHSLKLKNNKCMEKTIEQLGFIYVTGTLYKHPLMEGIFNLENCKSPDDLVKEIWTAGYRACGKEIKKIIGA